MNTIGIIALSGFCDESKIYNARHFFEKNGYKVKLSNNIFDKKRYLAGDDEAKLTELKRFYEDTEIDVIMCARGGYGAIRLINNIDYEAIKNGNNKLFQYAFTILMILILVYFYNIFSDINLILACILIIFILIILILILNKIIKININKLFKKIK